MRVAPRPPPAGFLPCHAVAAYEGAVRAALIAYKERGRRELRRPLGRALAASVAAGLPAGLPAVLVPVPSRRSALRQRGADTTGALALEAARTLRSAGVGALALPLLRLGRTTSDSAGLSAPARAANLAGAMTADLGHLRQLPAGCVPALMIVDDLLTTGASLAEAARALATAGPPAAAAAVVAVTLRRGAGLG